jgi:hypothetical protein
MAFTATTLSAAVAINDTSILVASLTGFAAGDLLRIDNEMMRVLSVPSAATVPVPVLRGQEGSAQVAHVASARVINGKTQTNLVSADWPQAAAGGPSLATYQAARARVYISVTATPTTVAPTPGVDTVVLLNGTSVINLTVSAPASGSDGDRLTVIGNGKAAHTVTFTTGLGAVGATADVATFAAGQQQGIDVMAAGVAWCGLGQVAGAATIAGVGLA